MSTPVNCHWISRFHTKPWETADRQLIFYDFNTRKIGQRYSKTLFSANERNDRETEARLNRLVETPLASVRRGLTSGMVEMPDWPTYRAAAMMVLLQAPRTIAAREGVDGDHLARMLRLPEEQLDQLVQLCMLGKKLMTYRVDESERVCFTSAGIFALPVVDPRVPGGMHGAIATPLDQRTFMAIISDSASFDEIHRMATYGNYFTATSVGLLGDKVALPPDVVAANDPVSLGDEIARWRRNNVETAQAFAMLAESARAMEAYGVQVDHNDSFRRARDARARARGTKRERTDVD